MRDEFPFVKVPPELRPIMGEPQEGTRCYYAEGDEAQAGVWFDTMCEHFIGVSPGGVSMFAPVSRSAVYKRMKEGRLTAFFFTITEVKRGLFGGIRKKRQSPFCYVPVSECKAWKEELVARGDHYAEGSGEVPDPDFLDEPDSEKRKKKWQRYQRKMREQGNERKS